MNAEYNVNTADMNSQDWLIDYVIKLQIFIDFCLFVMVAQKMENKTDELKKKIYQQFKPQWEMIKSVVYDVCALLIETSTQYSKEE